VAEKNSLGEITDIAGAENCYKWLVKFLKSFKKLKKILHLQPF